MTILTSIIEARLINSDASMYGDLANDRIIDPVVSALVTHQNTLPGALLHFGALFFWDVNPCPGSDDPHVGQIWLQIGQVFVAGRLVLMGRSVPQMSSSKAQLAPKANWKLCV